jgi:virginiamycin A acetyltransferase
MSKNITGNLFYLYKIQNNKFRSLIRLIILKFEDGYMWSSTIRKIYNQYYNISIGYGSYGAMFNPGSFKKGTVIGNYCSFASDIVHFNANHPYKRFTTHPILYDPVCQYVKEETLIRTKLVVGHGVWIGQGVIILPNVDYIGNGAIVWAGSVLTKSVAPYSIMAGNPAKVIGFRFNEEIINKLESSKWWDLDKDSLMKNIELLELIVSAKQ